MKLPHFRKLLKLDDQYNIICWILLDTLSFIDKDETSKINNSFGHLKNVIFLRWKWITKPDKLLNDQKLSNLWIYEFMN